MTTYRILKNGNKKIFVETTNKRFAISLYKEGLRNGDKMEIRQEKNGRFYKLEVES